MQMCTNTGDRDLRERGVLLGTNDISPPKEDMNVETVAESRSNRTTEPSNDLRNDENLEKKLQIGKTFDITNGAKNNGKKKPPESEFSKIQKLAVGRE